MPIPEILLCLVKLPIKMPRPSKIGGIDIIFDISKIREGSSFLVTHVIINLTIIY
jgi:hypothetical protein